MSWIDLLKSFINALVKKPESSSVPEQTNIAPNPIVRPEPEVAENGKMTMSRKGKMFLVGLEGICLSKYYDSVGVPTIGVGATRSEIPDLASWPMDKALSIKDCFGLLDRSLKKYEDVINKTLKVEVSQAQYDALVSICYNIGTGGLAKSTFMKRINANDSTQNIVNAILMWNKPPEIRGRRSKEAALFSTGSYAGGGKANLFPVSPKGRPMYSAGKIINLEDYL